MRSRRRLEHRSMTDDAAVDLILAVCHGSTPNSIHASSKKNEGNREVSRPNERKAGTQPTGTSW